MSRIVLTEEVSDPVVAAVGDLLEVRLVENAGTGYVWEFTTPAWLRLVSDSVEVGSLAGAAALRIVIFSVDAPGSGSVVASLRRPWESRPLESVSWSVTASSDA